MKYVKQVEASLFYTCGSEPRGHSAAVSFFVGLPGRTNAAPGSGRRERGYRIRRRFGGGACDGSVAPSDHGRIEGTAPAEGIARGSTVAIPNPAEGGRTKENRGQGPDSAGRSGPAGGSCDSWRSGIAPALDLQERAEIGGGTPARGSRRQLSDGGRTASRDGLQFASQPENARGEPACGSRPAVRIYQSQGATLSKAR